MKMIVHCCFFTVLSLALAACAGHSKTRVCSAQPGPASDKFRINLHLGSYDGKDVYNWQHFLKCKGFGLNDNPTHHYPNRHFDPATEEATMRFQASYSDGDGGIAVTGKVNWATYFRAVEKGMTAYETNPPHKLSTRNFGDYFRIIMRTGDSTGGVVPGHSPSVFNDVKDWQQFLVNIGYLGASYPTTLFDNPTLTKTSLWQHDAHVITTNYGKVDLNTYNMARTAPWGMDNSYIVVPHP